METAERDIYVHIVDKSQQGSNDKKAQELMRTYRTYCPITCQDDVQINGYQEQIKDIDLDKYNVIVFKDPRRYV